MLKHNAFFDGKVQSVGFERNGRRHTVGVIDVGEFHFGTDAPERMDIVAGRCRVRLDGQPEWREVEAGQSFQVPGKSGFDIVVGSGIAEYVCSFE